MSEPLELLSVSDVEAMLEASYERPLVVFKHSIACPASARGHVQLALLDGPGDPPCYRVVVQFARAASDHLAARLGVRHETPQALVVSCGDAVFHQSHGAIRAALLREAAHTAARDAA